MFVYQIAPNIESDVTDRSDQLSGSVGRSDLKTTHMVKSEKFTFDDLIKRTKDPVYEKVMQICGKYTDDPQYVYKMCIGRYLVVLKKTNETKHNELMICLGRLNFDPNCAKFRASVLEVVRIINLTSLLDETTVTNCYNGINTIYTVGNLVYPDRYDTTNIVCTNGIHYFKKPYVAYFYRKMPKDYTGTWFCWDGDGNLTNSIETHNGVVSGRHLVLYEDGSLKEESAYTNGMKNGLAVVWHRNGVKHVESYYVDDQCTGKYTKWDSDGNIESHGMVVNNLRVGMWHEYCADGSKIEAMFVDGRMIQRTDYHSNGNKWSEEHYTDNLPTKITEWHNNGMKRMETTYIDGMPTNRLVWSEDGIQLETTD
jgi:antitoxin component YwqK of YwqJK toxin-antitoxin module